MEVFGAIAMPLAMFGFVMSMYAIAKIGELEKQLKKLADEQAKATNT